MIASKLTTRLNVFVLLTLVFSWPLFASESQFTHPGKIVAVGDLHGDYEQYIQVLQTNKLINKKLKWIAGETHFVQLGDVTDRGPDSLKIIRHLMKLEKQAKRAGGKVHVLVGNHEAMNIKGDLRYVHPGEYEILVTRKSKRLQEQYVDLVFAHMLANDPTVEENKEKLIQDLFNQFPLGFVEHRRLWEPGQELAKWYASQNTVVQINDTLFIHAGIDPHVETFSSLDAINKTISDELSGSTNSDLATDERGPLWYRGLATDDEESLLGPVDRMLEHYNASRIVIGHQPTYGTVMPRLDGRILMADVGISAHYGGSLANLVIEQGELSVIHRGRTLALPTMDKVDEYLDQAASLEPANSRLVRYVKAIRQQALQENAASEAQSAEAQTVP